MHATVKRGGLNMLSNAYKNAKNMMGFNNNTNADIVQAQKNLKLAQANVELKEKQEQIEEVQKEITKKIEDLKSPIDNLNKLLNQTSTMLQSTKENVNSASVTSSMLPVVQQSNSQNNSMSSQPTASFQNSAIESDSASLPPPDLALSSSPQPESASSSASGFENSKFGVLSDEMKTPDNS